MFESSRVACKQPSEQQLDVGAGFTKMPHAQLAIYCCCYGYFCCC
jgi:hypothetical protein